jgi:glycosyltransferase involved in cell wall biosynthesis
VVTGFANFLRRQDHHVRSFFRMRILMATNYQPPHMGGIEYAAGSLKRCWEEDGHLVTWITTDIPRSGHPATPDNIRIPALNFFESLFQINSPVISPLSWKEIEKEVLEHDVINVHSLAPGLTSAVLHAALKNKRPTVATQHVGVIPLKLPLLNFVQRKVICRKAAHLVREGALLTFVGKAVRDWFVEEAKLPEDQIFMTPAGIDQQDFYFVTDQERYKFRHKWKIDQNKLNVLFVGRFYEKKGLPLLQVVAQRCPSAHFTFVGGGPINPARWKLPNVQVIPRVSTDELRELYGSHDAFIMPSVGEGWPAVVPQAMACGLPCLISEETFEGYGQDAQAFLICPRDADAIERVLAELTAGKIPALKLRKDLSDYAASAWDWKRTAHVYLDLFNRVIKSAPPKIQTAPPA